LISAKEPPTHDRFALGRPCALGRNERSESRRGVSRALVTFSRKMGGHVTQQRRRIFPMRSSRVHVDKRFASTDDDDSCTRESSES
jgi:hypothetical protein